MPLSLSRDRQELYRLIQGFRKNHGFSRLPTSRLLESCALSVAESIASGRCLPTEIQQHAQHLLTQRKERFHIECYSTQVSRVRRFYCDERLISEQLKSFGAGIAQSASSAPLWIVVIFRVNQRMIQGTD